MDISVSLQDVRNYIAKLNLEYAGQDGLFTEILRFGGNDLTNVTHCVTSDIWKAGRVPKKWRDAITIILCNGKCVIVICEKYRGMTLLCIAGKVLSDKILFSLNSHISIRIIKASKCKDKTEEQLT